ncbi:T9SS type A sorting domain-containing protein [bacterium]|nr:T9SS type A sorting domain-containing protein [bacterium]
MKKLIVTVLSLCAASVKKYFIMILVGLFSIVSIIKAQNDPWTEKCPLPERNSWLASCTLDEKVYIIGGATDLIVLSNVEVYDPATDTWNTKAEMPTRRMALSASVVEGFIYTFGGNIVSYPWIPSVATVEEYDPSLDQTTDVGNSSLVQHPDQFLLSQNYPNPFNPTTIIDYQLSISGEVELSVYNLLGQKIITLVSEKQVAGTYNIEWDATGFPSGIYLMELAVDGQYKQVKRLVLCK